MAAIALNELTEAKVEGTGVFDVLMKASQAHLEAEFKKNRIKGTEYSQVYLGSLTAILEASLQFLLSKQKADMEAQLLAKQILLTEQQTRQAEAQTALITQQTSNAIIEGENLEKQGCILSAQFDLLMEQKLKTEAETGLMNQKIATERAQTVEAGVDANSVIGRQRSLYQAQSDGFKRDAEQKAAKIMVDTWNVRRTTDEGTVADSTNKLHDVSVGRAVGKLLDGIGA